MVPGEPLPNEGDATLNEGRRTTTVTVANTGDRPVQVGSHFTFFETNKALRFDREGAYTACAWTSPPALPSASSPAASARPRRHRGCRIVKGLNGVT